MMIDQVQTLYWELSREYGEQNGCCRQELSFATSDTGRGGQTKEDFVNKHEPVNITTCV